MLLEVTARHAVRIGRLYQNKPGHPNPEPCRVYAAAGQTLPYLAIEIQNLSPTLNRGVEVAHQEIDMMN